MTEHQSWPITEFKALTNGDEVGSFEALVAVFGNVDYGGDRLEKGAFARTLGEWAQKGRTIPVLWSHDAEAVPIGVVTKATETNAGLKVKARLLIDDNPQAKAVHAAMKAGALHEFSFGYGVKEYGIEGEGDQEVRVLKDVTLFEVSPVFRGMNPDTALRAVKSLSEDAPDLDELMADQKTLNDLSEKYADVALKAVADSLQDVIDGEAPPETKDTADGAVEQETKDTEAETSGEQQDNPEPNPEAEAAGEEAKARIRRLLAERPLHPEGQPVDQETNTDGNNEPEPAPGETV